MKTYQVLLAATLGCVLSAPVLAAQSLEAAKASEELKAVLRQHHEALNKQDIKALLALYADNPNVVLMGTGPGEFWKGKAAVEDTYRHFFQTFKVGSLTHECPDTAGGESGNTAWLVASCRMKELNPAGQPHEFWLNVSAVLKKEKDGWRYQTLHFSNLASDDVPPPAGAAPAPATAPKKAN
jgi:ketosteroid isomerase-like protein